MNAVAATTNSDPGSLAAASQPSAPSLAQGGFVNLINALLGSQEPAAEADTNTVSDNSQDTTAEPVNVRSSAEIADALIRSMLRGPLTTNNLISDRTPAQTGPTKERQPSQDAGNLPVVPVSTPVVPTPIPAMPITVPILPPSAANNTQTPLLTAQTSTALSTVQMSTAKLSANSVLGNATLLTNPGVLASDSKSVAPKADLAFALRLTPVETQVGDAPTALPVTLAVPAATVPAKTAPATTAPATTAPATTAPAQETAQNMIPAPIESPPAPPEPRAQGKDDSSPSNPFAPQAAPKQRQESDLGQDAVSAVAAPAAADDHSGDFARSLPNLQPPSVPVHNTEQTQTSPMRSAEQALRTSESVGLEVSVPKAPTAQHIAVRIAGPESTAVDLQVIERAGQVHVSVRTADTGLQSSLRQDLGTLVNSLERSGYRAESFTGRDAASLTAVAVQTAGASHMDARNNGQNSGQNDREAQQDRPSQGGSRDQQNHSGGGQQQQRRPQNDWIDTLEKTQ